MKTTIFQGLQIRIENPAGSIRKGIDSDTGLPWCIRMVYPYGEIIGSKGTDGDPVDVFIGPNKQSKFVYIVHQLVKSRGTFDEDKCFLGFDDVMAAKKAFYESYDMPDKFFGSIETIPLDVFKEKIKESKHDGSQMIRASKINTAIELYAKEVKEPLTVGAQVTADGVAGRGVIKSIDGDRITVQYRNGLTISRDRMYIHNIADHITKEWRD